MGQSRVGAEHLLIGLARDGDGPAAKALRGTAVTQDNVRSEVRRIASQNPSGALA